MNYIRLSHTVWCEFFNERRTSLVTRLQQPGTVTSSVNYRTKVTHGGVKDKKVSAAKEISVNGALAALVSELDGKGMI